jgi:hypothetical protein
MKTLYTLLLLSLSVLAFGQNENPYSVFGYEAPIMKDVTPIQERTDQFVFVNPDTTSTIGMLAIDMKKREMTFYDKKGIATKSEKINEYSLARWLSVDPKNQFASPYVGMGNNPVMGVDPDGQFVFTVLAAIFAPPLLPAAIGADIGMWRGGSMANGTANPFKWDYSSGRTWGYMAGGAVVGGLSGGAANAVATSGIPFANTAAIATGSFLNSFGTHLYTGGQTDISIDFGVASYNISQNEWGYLGKSGNTGLQNLGFGLGALGNLNDAWNVAFPKQQGANLYTDKDDPVISHSAWGESPSNGLVSFGPDKKNPYFYSRWKAEGMDALDFGSQSIYNVKSYAKFGLGLPGKSTWWDYTHYNNWEVVVPNINRAALKAVNGFSKILPYQGLTLNCVNVASLGGWLSGIPNIGLHPWLLHASMQLYTNGFRPDLYSYYLTNGR